MSTQFLKPLANAKAPGGRLFCVAVTFGLFPALLAFPRRFWPFPGAFGLSPALLGFPRRPRVLAPKNSVQYPIFVQKMPETGNRCHFHLLIPSIFEISGYQKAKYSCNTRRQEINSVSPSRRQEISHSKSTPHVPSQLHVLSPVPPALH